VLSVEAISLAAEAAADRLEGRVIRTPLLRYDRLSDALGVDVCLKLENQQHTGSFKYRGALNRLLTLDEARRQAGVVVASSGNHGAAVARAMQEVGVTGIVFVPEKVSSAKLDAIRQYGAAVELYGSDGLDTELHARDYAGTHGMFYLSPYNDPEVIAGQGSLGVELAEEMPDFSVVVIAVGGGGLLSGVAAVMKSRRPGMSVLAVQPAASAVMAHSVAAGRVLELEDSPTLSDGTAGGVEADAITFDPVATLADEFVLVPEFEIALAMRELNDDLGILVEGAAALTIAAIKARAAQLTGKRVVAIVCGGNVADDTAAMAMAMAGSQSASRKEP
jgi:threonine dehydratase